MRISLIHSYYDELNPSGENTTVDRQAATLQNAGHSVTLIAARTDDLKQTRGYRIKAASHAAGFSSNRDIQTSLEDAQPDVIHVHNTFPNWGHSWMKSAPAPIVTTLHNYRVLCSNGLLWRDGHECSLCPDKGSLNAIKHRCYRQSAVATVPLAISTSKTSQHPIVTSSKYLVVLNDQAKSRIEHYTGRRHVVVIPNFSEVAAKQSTPIERAGWAYIGRLTAEKGVHWLASNWIHKETLHIVGDGPMHEEVRNVCAASEGSVKYHGRIHPNQIAAFIRSKRGLVVPSMWSEGIPTVALEALASGTPVAMSSNCSSAGMITQGGGGTTFKIDENGEDLHDSLLKLEKKNCSDMAIKTHAEYFSPNVWLKSIEAVYEKAVSS